MKIFNRFNANQQILANKGAIPLPNRLTFEPTLACNLTCTMCDRYEKPDKYNLKYLSFENIKDMIERLPRSIRQVYIVGGEPMIRNDIIDICREFLKKGIRVHVHTNGTFVDATLKLSSFKDVTMHFSIDGPSDMHNQIRGQSYVFERNAKIFNEFKMQKKYFSINSVITEENIDVLKELIRILEEEGIKPNFLNVELARRYTKEIIEETAGILGIMPSDIPMYLKENAIPNYSFEKFRENVIELDKELRKYRFKYSFSPINLLDNLKDFYFRTFRKNNELHCTHFDELRIDSRGNIVHCHIIRKSFGNVLERPIEEIWNSEEFCQFRVNLVKNNLAPVCETCYRAEKVSFIKNPYIRIKELIPQFSLLNKKNLHPYHEPNSEEETIKI